MPKQKSYTVKNMMILRWNIEIPKRKSSYYVQNMGSFLLFQIIFCKDMRVLPAVGDKEEPKRYLSKDHEKSTEIILEMIEGRDPEKTYYLTDTELRERSSWR